MALGKGKKKAPEGVSLTPEMQAAAVREAMRSSRKSVDDVVADVPDVNTGDAFVGPVEAVVDYAFGNYKYYPTATPARIDNGLQREVTEAPRANQLAMASMNVENLDSLESDLPYPEESLEELEAETYAFRCGRCGWWWTSYRE